MIDSFGYGDLKLGMTLQQALDANHIGPALQTGKPADLCTLHDIVGTSQKAWVSKTKPRATRRPSSCSSVSTATSRRRLWPFGARNATTSQETSWGKNMNRSIILIAVTAALGLAACTSTPTPAPDNNATSSTTTPSTSVVTQVVTQTVTNPPAAPPKPVIDSFGYGPLKLGMARQQALDAKLIGPALEGGKPADTCTLHEITGTSAKAWVSATQGVASIAFTPDMTSDGVGAGVTEEKLKAEYTNLKPAVQRQSFSAPADNNPAAKFFFSVDQGKVMSAYLSRNNQDCHN
ncbi:hypothetical protein ACIA8G_34475 [Lentzea sp. NPDC051213]|uniref:hypothetical protein n=1 Tax=Lentzea sp. NPDC051213 TaxID=3364126 RepID=UPI0037A7BA21